MRHQAKSAHHLRPQQFAEALQTKLIQHQAKSTNTTKRIKYQAEPVHHLRPQHLAEALHYSSPRPKAMMTHTRLIPQLDRSNHTHTNTHHTDSTIFGKIWKDL